MDAEKKVFWYKLQGKDRSCLINPKSITKISLPENGPAIVELDGFLPAHRYVANSIIAVDELGQELAIIFSANYRIEDFKED